MPVPQQHIGDEIMDEAMVATALNRLAPLDAPATLLPGVLARLGLADAYSRVDSLIGPLFVAFNADGVSAVRQGQDAEAFERWFRATFKRDAVWSPRLPARLERAIGAALRGEPGRADGVPLDLRAVSKFQRAVLDVTRRIPRGEVRSYEWVAREIGQPSAARAVGNALHTNPVPLLIPCHRVVPSNAPIGNYAFGAERKQAVLAAEGVDTERLQRLAADGVRFIGSDTTHIFCVPTCRHARRIQPEHQVPFANASRAASAGYRPCLVCRPAPAAVAA